MLFLIAGHCCHLWTLTQTIALPLATHLNKQFSCFPPFATRGSTFIDSLHLNLTQFLTCFHSLRNTKYVVLTAIMDLGENRDRSGAAARLDNLDSAFRLVDEIGGSLAGAAARPPPSLRHDSVSTRPYNDNRNDGTEGRMDAMERSLSAMARSLQEMRISREQNPPPPPLGRYRHYSDRGHLSRQDPDDFVRDHLQRERMDMPNFEGKQYAGDIFTTRLIPKPYMFVKKLSSASLRKKQNYRPNITASEYVNAFIAMLCDYRAREPADILNQLKHLHDVTTDIMTRPWHSVREWSQSVFDEIEKGDLTWNDFSSIQFARCCLSFIGAASAHDSTAATPQSSNPPHNRETICLEYNNKQCPQGGKFKHHVENGVRFVHTCLYCYASTGSKRDHPMSDPCGMKLKDRAALTQLYQQSLYQPQHAGPAYQHPKAAQNAQQNSTRYRQFNPQVGAPQAPANPQQLPKNR